RRNIFVSISLDGEPELHDAQRPNAGGKGSWKAVEAGIERLLAWNPVANVTCVITPESAERVHESVPWIYDLGFRFITTALDYRSDWTQDALDRLRKSYTRLGKWYEARMRSGEHFYLSCFDDRIQSRTRAPLAPTERCSIGYKQFSITPEGELYPCIQFVTTERIPEFRIGDLTHGFDESYRARMACSTKVDDDDCAGCALSERCNNWCACVNYQSTGRIDQVSPVVCLHEQLLIEVADRVGNRLWKRREKMFLQKHYDPVYSILAHADLLPTSPNNSIRP
ncbi:MAG: SPASM domain-containing protein, partial [Bacteroidota bacterium]